MPSLRAGTVPSNRKELMDNTREKSAAGFYDITKTWFEADTFPAHAPFSVGPDAPASQDTGPVIVGTDAAADEVDMDNVSSIPIHNPDVVTQDNTLDGPTAQDTNEYVNFEEGSHMPPMLNVQTDGLRRSPRIAKLNRPWYKCNLIAKYFCALALASSFQWTPTLSGVYTGAENMVLSAVHSYHSANQLFDDTLNSLHPTVCVGWTQVFFLFYFLSLFWHVIE